MLRLNDVDQLAWGRISVELGQLSDEIADDVPLLADEDDPWPAGAVAVEIWNLLTRAELLALFVSRLPEGGRCTMERLRELFDLEAPQTTNEETE